LTIKRFAILLVKYSLLAVGLLVTAGVSALTTMRVVLTSQEVTVPSLIGKRTVEAGAMAARHRLLVRIEGRRNDPRIQPDRIVAQEPPPGATLKSQRSVRVWVSMGPRQLLVPEVEGESLRTARIILERAQLPLGRAVGVADAAPEGTILMQHPLPGQTDVLAPEGASLLYSLGPGRGDYVMPDLIGHRGPDALDQLRDAGLKVTETRYRTYPGLAPGLVLRQVPPAGHRVSREMPITLEISRSSE
jgi:serine/threonine-protein kinase